MWLKIYIAVILLIVILTLLWYWRALKREKMLLKNERNGKIDKKEPVLEIVKFEEDDSEFNPFDNLVNERHEIKSQSKTQPLSSPLPPLELIRLEIRAYPDQPYMGYELLQALLAAGFRYAEMNVFNRYAEDGKTALFSLSVSSPTHSFELSTMGGFSCSGLIMTMPLTCNHLSRILDLMINTASELLEDLGGELLDEKQNPIDNEMIKQWKDRIRVFESKQSI